MSLRRDLAASLLLEAAKAPLTCTEVSDDDRCYGCWSVTFGKPCPTCDLPRCESCGAADDNLYEGLCRECEDFGAPSGAALWQWERAR